VAFASLIHRSSTLLTDSQSLLYLLQLSVVEMNKLTGMMMKSPRTNEPSSPWSLFRSNNSAQRGEAQQQRALAPLTVALAQSLEAALVELA
jgi:hypothetical protein